MRKKKPPEHVNHERWLVSYADFITLLFAFFVVMFAVSQVDSKKVGRFTEAFQSAIGIDLTVGGKGMLPAEGEAPLPPATATASASGVPTAVPLPPELDAIANALTSESKQNSLLAGLKVVRRGNELVLRIDAMMLFQSGSDEMTEEARRVLRAIAEQLRDRPLRIRVEGHTDNQPIRSGRFRSNWELSTARATRVVTELADVDEIQPERLAAVGYGQYQPLGDNGSVDGRSQNRRVDFVLSLHVPAPR
ncbi:MAG: flagellar motor protein MotB [Polyangiaceae bacterium]